MAIAVVAETDVVLPADHQVGLLAGRFGGRRHQHHRAQLGAAAPRRLGRQLSDARRALELLRPPEPQRKSFFFIGLPHGATFESFFFFASDVPGLDQPPAVAGRTGAALREGRTALRPDRPGTPALGPARHG